MTIKIYKTIVADPPWMERGGGKIKRGANRHYPLLPTKDIPGVMLNSGYWNPDPAGCSVWLWTTRNFLGDAFWVLEQLKVKYVTDVVWVKTKNKTLLEEYKKNPVNPAFESILSLGLGQRFRSAHEHLLYGRIGKVPVPSTDKRLPSVVFAPVEGHSKKPDVFFDLINTHDPQGNRLEMFARTPRTGYDNWGNEILQEEITHSVPVDNLTLP